MILARTLIFGLPLLIGVLAWWSAREAGRSRSQPTDGIVIMLPQTAPALNPYLPATEVERQIIDLVHEPFLRIGTDGTLQAALAELWRWTQDVTCWFADEATAKQAQERLQAQIGEKNLWAEWRLSSARVQGNALLLNFSDTAADGVENALQLITDLRPQPAAFWRVDCRVPLHSAWSHFMATSPQARQIQRVWFDGANACEIVVAGPAQSVLDEMRLALNAATKESCTLNLLGEVGALVEPVLDLDIRPGRTWHDGTPVSAEDARATLEFLRGNDWPLPNRESLRHIQSLESRNNGAQLHVTFRRRYGPALGMFADLPVLPAAWWRDHHAAQDADFFQNPPPGAGNYRVAARDAHSLILVPARPAAGVPRFLFNFSASPLMTQIGVRTRTVGLVWPAAATDRAHFTQLRFTPPRQRLVVLWNTRHALLKNVRFREALALATDIDDLVRMVPGRLGHADASLFAPGLWFSTGAEREPFALEKARQILIEEGWPQDVYGLARRAGRAFEFTLLVPSTDAIHTRAAQRLAAQWLEVGVKVMIERIPDARLLAQRLQEHRFDAVLLDQRFEVSWDQLPWWHSSLTNVGGTNFCGIADPQIDLQLEALAGEFDPARVPGRVRELESRLLPLRPLLTLFTTHEEAAAAPTLQDRRTPVAESSWTLRALALPKKPTQASPAVDLKLRVAD